MYRKLTTVAAVAALGFGLAACGGGGSDSTPTTSSTTTTEPAAPDVAALLVTAHDARTDAENAEEAAAQAVKDAAKYSTMYSTAAVHGDSMTAQANAQKVLDAKAAADQAVTDAEAAKMAAEDALTEAEDIPADDPQRAAVMAAIQTAIDTADDAIEAAMKSAADDDLADNYEAVVGANKAKPRTAGYHGEQVAMAVGGVLMPGENGARTDGTPHTDTNTDIPTATDNKSLVSMNDATGKSWAMIVGEDNVSMMRLGAGTTNVPVASIAGLVAATVMPTNTPTAGTDGQEIDETDTTYTGIPGSVHCLGDDCKVDDDGKLTGSWYFEPDSPRESYVKGTDDTGTADVDESKLYTPETNYTRFGHWLVLDDTTEALTAVRTYAWSNGTTTGVVTDDSVATLADSATYSGTAAGMSLHKTFDSQGEQQSIYSGRFTADVSLEADFGTTARLSGTIDNFQGPVTDSSWSVELKESNLSTDGTTAATGDTDTGGSGSPGVWSNQYYGEAMKRPAGIYGGFTAHWTDGHATGAYATRKDE